MTAGFAPPKNLSVSVRFLALALRAVPLFILCRQSREWWSETVDMVHPLAFIIATHQQVGFVSRQVADRAAVCQPLSNGPALLVSCTRSKQVNIPGKCDSSYLAPLSNKEKACGWSSLSTLEGVHDGKGNCPPSTMMTCCHGVFLSARKTNC